MATFVSRNDDGGSWHPFSRYSLPAVPHSDRKSRVSGIRQRKRYKDVLQLRNERMAFLNQRTPSLISSGASAPTA